MKINTHGFSVMSVLIALAMTGVLGMTLMSLMKNSTDMYITSKAREEADATRFVIATVLQNADACKKSLLGAGVPLSQIESRNGVAIPKIVSQKNTTVLETSKEENLSAMVLEPLSQDRNVASLNSSRYLGQLRLKFKDNKAASLGGGVADRILPVVLTLSGNSATGCTAAPIADPEDSGTIPCLSARERVFVPVGDFSNNVPSSAKALRLSIAGYTATRRVGGGSGQDGGGTGMDTVSVTVPGTNFNLIFGKTKVGNKVLEPGKVLRREGNNWYYDGALIASQDASSFSSPMGGDVDRSPGSIDPAVEATTLGATCPKPETLTGSKRTLEGNQGNLDIWQ